jgi:transcriptional regulator GlxA family with amidase domain
LSLRISASALERKLYSILGYRPKGALVFDTTVVDSRPGAQIVRDLMKFVVHQLDFTDGGLPHFVLRELEQTIATALLSANRHTFSHLLARSPAEVTPREVRIAEEYIEANWDKPIRVEDLVAVTKVSARSLFRTFRTVRGSSPMAFARIVRLKRAKHMLTASPANTSVTAVALMCGFGNPGHFAKYYAEAFGELPSETLARTRRTTD